MNSVKLWHALTGGGVGPSNCLLSSILSVRRSLAWLRSGMVLSASNYQIVDNVELQQKHTSASQAIQ